MARVPAAALLALVAIACARGAPSSERDAASIAVSPPPIRASYEGEGAARILSSRADVALRGARVEAAPGDFVLENAGNVAVVSARGTLIDFGAKDGDDELVSI